MRHNKASTQAQEMSFWTFRYGRIKLAQNGRYVNIHTRSQNDALRLAATLRTFSLSTPIDGEFAAMPFLEGTPGVTVEQVKSLISRW